jgi:hypothetical protein
VPDTEAALRARFPVPEEPVRDFTAPAFREARGRVARRRAHDAFRRLHADWDKRAEHRRWFGHLARDATLWVLADASRWPEEERTFDRFLQLRGWALRGMANSLGLSERETWAATLDAIEEAKSRPGWHLYQETDWASLVALRRREIDEHDAKYPNHGRRWRAADDAGLRERFALLREQGLPRHEGFAPGDAMLTELAAAAGRTPLAVRERLIKLRLINRR